MELCDIFDGAEHEILRHGMTSVDIKGIAIDSRKVESGFIFVCISGLKNDGHDYIDEAVRNGATVVVVERGDVDVPVGVTLARVTSTRGVLNRLAANFYGNPSGRMRVVGVTGTKGKTSVTYYLEKILSECGYTVGIIGTTGALANGETIDIPYATSTTPDAIELQAIFAEMAKRGVNYCVMEVSSHALALNKVGDVDFAAGIFTNLTHDHLDFHGDMDNYLRAKAKLFDLSRVAVINDDDERAGFLADYAEGKSAVLTFGIDAQRADVRAVNVKLGADSSAFDVVIGSYRERYALNIPGKFSVSNALAAITAAYALKMPLDGIKRGVAAITSVRGRLQKVENPNGFTVLVDYAHTPDSLEKVIAAVREFTEGRVITVFGCGGDRDPFKRPIMGEIAGRLSDMTVITSDNPRNEEPDAIINAVEGGLLAGEQSRNARYVKITDRYEAIRYAVTAAQSGDAVIIAGKGHEDYQEFENKRKIHFDDAEAARAALAALEY